MSDPTRIQLDDGETEQIIFESDVGSGLPYAVEVYGNPVRYSHEAQNAQRGLTLAAGQTHTLSNFRGEGIWINAFAGAAEVRVREAGAAVESQPPKGVSVEGDVQIGSDIDITDRAGREIGKARLMDSGGTLVDPATAFAQGPWPGVTTGQASVSTAGTAVQLNSGSSLSVPAGATVALSTPVGNTGPAYVGGSTVDASSGYVLDPGNSVEIPVADVSSLWVDAANSGDSVSWVVVQ